MHRHAFTFCRISVYDVAGDDNNDCPFSRDVAVAAGVMSPCEDARCQNSSDDSISVGCCEALDEYCRATGGTVGIVRVECRVRGLGVHVTRDGVR